MSIKTEGEEDTPPKETEILNQALTIAPRPRISKIWMPKFLTLDAIEAWRRLRSVKEGEAQFPGSKTADLELSEGIAHQPEAYFERRGELVIGTGNGRFGKFGESATMAMTEALGIQEDRILKKITAAVRRSVEDRGARTELSSIITVLHRVLNRHGVVNYVSKIMHYVHDGLIHRRVKKGGDGTLQTFFDELCNSKKGKTEFADERARNSLAELVQASVERRNNSIIELSYITDCLICEEGPADAKKIVQNLLLGLYQDEVIYWQAVELCKVASKHTAKICGRRGEDDRKINVIFVQTDNPLIPQASRHSEVGDVGVTVVQNATGNLAIYVDRKLPVNLIGLWRMVQSLELLAQGWSPKDIPWEDLKAVEGHENIQDIWKFIIRKNKIMNGFSQGDVAASKITGEALLYAIQHSLHPYGIPKWQREHGITITRKERAFQTVEEAVNGKATNSPTPEVIPAVDVKASKDTSTADVKAPNTLTPKPAKAKRSRKPLTTPVSIQDLEIVLETAQSNPNAV